MIFYLGTHEPYWLNKTTAPLFISVRRLRRIKQAPRSIGHWAIDSGGFSELSLFGKWETSPNKYAQEVARHKGEIGGLAFAVIQDWMCEPFMLQRTGKSISEHQRLTVESYETLLSLNSSLPWLPVLQGYSMSDYMRCLELYINRGHSVKYYGVGSVCRRQSTREGSLILRTLSRQGLRLHAFGFKTLGLPSVSNVIASSDSMAWSYHARKRPALPGHAHKSCANCLDYALQWRDRLLREDKQLQLGGL